MKILGAMATFLSLSQPATQALIQDQEYEQLGKEHGQLECLNETTLTFSFGQWVVHVLTVDKCIRREKSAAFEHQKNIEDIIPGTVLCCQL